MVNLMLMMKEVINLRLLASPRSLFSNGAGASQSNVLCSRNVRRSYITCLAVILPVPQSAVRSSVSTTCSLSNKCIFWVCPMFENR